MSEGEGSGGEKTHEASPQRLDKAHEQGDIARSPDALMAMNYIGFAIAMALAGAAGAATLAETLIAPLAHPYDLAREMFGGGGVEVTGALLWAAGLGIAMLVAGPMVAVLGLLVATRGIVLSPDKILPKLSRISPLSNAMQKYGLTGLVEFLKSFIKLLALGAFLCLLLAGERNALTQYVHVEARMMMQILSHQFWQLMQGVLVVAITIGVLDWFYQRFAHAKRLRMTLQEVRDEQKNIEGDPHVKAQRRERGREIANNRMLNDVPRADVVLTNPTHYAVALQWHRTPGSAPICIAKGMDELAMAIRERAEAAKVPIHADPPAARAIHAAVKIGQEVHPEHYAAVAAAIVFADGLRKRRNARA